MLALSSEEKTGRDSSCSDQPAPNTGILSAELDASWQSLSVELPFAAGGCNQGVCRPQIVLNIQDFRAFTFGTNIYDFRGADMTCVLEGEHRRRL
jgi:hypothetical protein